MTDYFADALVPADCWKRVKTHRLRHDCRVFGFMCVDAMECTFLANQDEELARVLLYDVYVAWKGGARVDRPKSVFSKLAAVYDQAPSFGGLFYLPAVRKSYSRAEALSLRDRQRDVYATRTTLLSILLLYTDPNTSLGFLLRDHLLPRLADPTYEGEPFALAVKPRDAALGEQVVARVFRGGRFLYRRRRSESYEEMLASDGTVREFESKVPEETRRFLLPATPGEAIASIVEEVPVSGTVASNIARCKCEDTPLHGDFRSFQAWCQHVLAAIEGSHRLFAEQRAEIRRLALEDKRRIRSGDTWLVLVYYYLLQDVIPEHEDTAEFVEIMSSSDVCEPISTLKRKRDTVEEDARLPPSP